MVPALRDRPGGTFARLGIVLVVCGAIYAPPRVGAEMPTVCLGRILFDLPEGAEIAGRTDIVDGIQIVRRRVDEDASLESIVDAERARLASRPEFAKHPDRVAPIREELDDGRLAILIYRPSPYSDRRVKAVGHRLSPNDLFEYTVAASASDLEGLLADVRRLDAGLEPRPALGGGALEPSPLAYCVDGAAVDVPYRGYLERSEVRAMIAGVLEVVIRVETNGPNPLPSMVENFAQSAGRVGRVASGITVDGPNPGEVAGQSGHEARLSGGEPAERLFVFIAPGRPELRDSPRIELRLTAFESVGPDRAEALWGRLLRSGRSLN